MSIKKKLAKKGLEHGGPVLWRAAKAYCGSLTLAGGRMSQGWGGRQAALVLFAFLAFDAALVVGYPDTVTPPLIGWLGFALVLLAWGEPERRPGCSGWRRPWGTGG